MTWVVTAVATGLGTSTVGATVILGTAAAAGLSAYGQYEQGKIQEAEYKRQAKEAELESTTSELVRRREINKRLAMNVVGQATSGIQAEGTPASIALADAKDISLSESLETLSDRLKQAQLRRMGSAAGQVGKIGAASTLLKGATDTTSAYGKYSG